MLYLIQKQCRFSTVRLGGHYGYRSHVAGFRHDGSFVQGRRFSIFAFYVHSRVVAGGGGRPRRHLARQPAVRGGEAADEVNPASVVREGPSDPLFVLIL